MASCYETEKTGEAQGKKKVKERMRKGKNKSDMMKDTEGESFWK